MAEADDLLVRVLCRALAGVDVDVVPDGTTAASRVSAALAAAGWTPDRLQALRLSRQDEGQPWPFPVDVEQVRPVGFARYGTVLREVRAALGLDGLVPVVHQGPKVVGPAELRLLAEVPPHHGNVG